MNNKLMFVFGFIAALIVALAFSSVSAKWFGKSGVQFAPNETNANDCSADEKCVIQNAIVEKSIDAPFANLVSMQGQSLKMIYPNSNFAGLITQKSIAFGAFLRPQDVSGFFDSDMSNVARLSAYEVEVYAPFMRGHLYNSTRHTSEGLFGYRLLNLTSSESNVFTLSSNAISSKYLEGNGTAYACIDSTGKLFRSKNPCR